MTPESLLGQFDVMTEAPGGVQHLRELILQLAVRGRLVAQTRSDEPAAALFDPIAAELGRALSPVETDEAPHETPEGWAWVRMGDAMNLVNGRAFKPAEWATMGTPIVRIQNLNNPAAPFNYCASEVPAKFYIGDEDLLLSWSGTPGTSFGAFVWRRGRAVLNQHIFRCELRGRAYLNDFARIAINARLDEMIAQAHGGVGLQHITKGKLDRLAIVLPPLAEQRRIVAKVDELMTLCNELEARQQRRAEVRKRANVTVLQQLTTATDDAALAIAWERLQEHGDDLLVEREAIANLRTIITTLALSGRLVAHEPAEGTVAATLARVRDEQHQRGNTVKAGRSATPLTNEVSQEPFTIPAAWQWVPLRALLVDGPRNGLSPRPVDGPTATRVLSLSATTTGRFDDRHFKYVDDNVPRDAGYWLMPGDLLFQRGNTIDYVGIAAIYDGPAEAFIYPDLMIRVRCAEAIDLRYVHLAANSPVGREHFARRATGTSSSMPKISQRDVIELPIPLPPVDEQRRIVQRYASLMALCDELEARLARAQDRATHLASSVVHHLTAA